jgi:hypothetical protein
VAMAFIDMGDQFIALSRGRHQQPDRDRHFGLVWTTEPLSVTSPKRPARKSPGVLHVMGLNLTKTEKASKELREKGIG